MYTQVATDTSFPATRGRGGGVLDRRYALDLVHGRSRMTLREGHEQRKWAALGRYRQTMNPWTCCRSQRLRPPRLRAGMSVPSCLVFVRCTAVQSTALTDNIRTI